MRIKKKYKFNNLPQELVFKIIKNLDSKSLLKFCNSSKQYSLYSNDDYLAKYKLKNLFKELRKRKKKVSDERLKIYKRRDFHAFAESCPKISLLSKVYLFEFFQRDIVNALYHSYKNGYKKLVNYISSFVLEEEEVIALMRDKKLVKRYKELIVLGIVPLFIYTFSTLNIVASFLILRKEFEEASNCLEVYEALIKRLNKDSNVKTDSTDEYIPSVSAYEFEMKLHDEHKENLFKEKERKERKD